MTRGVGVLVYSITLSLNAESKLLLGFSAVLKAVAADSVAIFPHAKKDAVRMREEGRLIEGGLLFLSVRAR